MDISGSNRYELLFMDDDSAALPANAKIVNKMKQPKSVTTGAEKSITSAAKKNLNIEKENKSGTLNKNDAISKKCIKGQGKPKVGLHKTSLKKNHTFDVESLKVDFKSQINEVCEEKKNHRSFREFGIQSREVGNEHRDPRYFRDRDNRGPSRNREGTFRGSKREFDRQSGSDKTGVKCVDKRDGAGAHNWGSVKQEIEEINKSTTDADATLTDKEESSNDRAPEQSAILEEEVQELTLDEWKALRGERTKPQYNIRKPNEGEDTSQWKQMVVLNKKKDGDSEEEYEYDPSMYPQRVGRLQRIVDIQFNFKDGRRGGGFGRGRGRGPRPGGDNKIPRPVGDRQPKQHRNFGDRQQKRPTPNALKVDDEHQFPTLS